MSALRIAVAQPVVTADAAANGTAVRRMMRAAADRGARLVHFPEGMLSGRVSDPRSAVRTEF